GFQQGDLRYPGDCLFSERHAVLSLSGRKGAGVSAMAVEGNVETSKRRNVETGSGSAGQDVTAGRKLAVGANVAIAVAAAAGLLVAVNWIFSIKHVRKDIASGNY